MDNFNAKMREIDLNNTSNTPNISQKITIPKLSM